MAPTNYRGDTVSDHDEPSTTGGLEAEKARRLARIGAMRDSGTDPYPYRFDRSHSLAEIRAEHGHLEAGTETETPVAVAGRVMLSRDQGKLIFVTLQDRTDTVQLFVSKSVVGDEAFDEINTLDLGDWVGVHGTVMTTRKGELSVKVSSCMLLSKAVRPLPDKWHGITDTDTRYRQRYADLIVNEESRRMFEVRHAMIASFRRTLAERDFIEVETPVLHVEAGGAHARPFTTHHNALDMQLYLRIALELHLKRLIVGGMERVYEIGRVFRNEGVSNRHNPEFTLLEFYEAYTDLEGMMERVETLFASVCRQVFGTEIVSVPAPGNSEGATLEIDFGQPWQRLDLLEAIERHSGLSPYELSSLDRAKEALGSRAVINPLTGKRIVAEDERHLGGLIEKLLEVFVEPHLVQPTFIVGYPIETSPLAKKDPNRAGFTRRFEGYILCREVCNAFSEINDPIDQRERFERQMEERAAGNDEAQELDEEFIYALECGMPPTGGCGIGMDRMVMLLTGAQHIREVLMFPMMKPEQHHEEPDSNEN